jgi:hypothetical protein
VRLVHLDDGVLAGELLRGGAVLIALEEFLRRGKLDRAGIGEPVASSARSKPFSLSHSAV